jgi:hypothetical protein
MHKVTIPIGLMRWQRDYPSVMTCSSWWVWATRWRRQTSRRACEWGAAVCTAFCCSVESGSAQSAGSVQSAARAGPRLDTMFCWLQGGPHQVPDPDPAAAQDRPHSHNDDGGGEAGRDVRRHRCGHCLLCHLAAGCCSLTLLDPRSDVSNPQMAWPATSTRDQHLSHALQAGARSR